MIPLPSASWVDETAAVCTVAGSQGTTSQYCFERGGYHKKQKQRGFAWKSVLYSMPVCPDCLNGIETDVEWGLGRLTAPESLVLKPISYSNDGMAFWLIWNPSVLLSGCNKWPRTSRVDDQHSEGVFKDQGGGCQSHGEGAEVNWQHDFQTLAVIQEPRLQPVSWWTQERIWSLAICLWPISNLSFSLWTGKKSNSEDKCILQCLSVRGRGGKIKYIERLDNQKERKKKQMGRPCEEK